MDSVPNADDRRPADKRPVCGGNAFAADEGSGCDDGSSEGRPPPNDLRLSMAALAPNDFLPPIDARPSPGAAADG